MNLIGYWISSLDDDEFPPPQELLADYTSARRQAIADYLDAGVRFLPIAESRGAAFYKCKHPMGHRELTDGVWVWPEGLSHYVRDHHVRLPEEFVQHALEQLGQPISVEERWESISLGTSFWKSWCAEHRSHALRPRIAAARRRAAAEAQQIRLDTIAACERTKDFRPTVVSGGHVPISP